MMGNNPDMEIVLTDSIQKVLWTPKQEGLEKALEKRADYQAADPWKLKLLECRPV